MEYQNFEINIDFEFVNRLKILNISQNVIRVMPSFGKRCSILELYMSRNELEDSCEIDALDFLIECTNIRRLHLAFNKIKHISDKCISVWKDLEELILCGNQLRSLSAKICCLTNLRVLRLHFNQLESAPDLTKLPALKVIDLSHNKLRNINLENLISGGNLTYLDISCNERLTLNPEKLQNPSKRQMNLVEVTNPRKFLIHAHINNGAFPANPPWELGFSEVPDRNQNLSVTQYRDVNMNGGKSALFGLFDGGNGNPAPKSITRSIAKIYTEERHIEESSQFSLKYTLLNSLRERVLLVTQNITCQSEAMVQSFQPTCSICTFVLFKLGPYLLLRGYAKPEERLSGMDKIINPGRYRDRIAIDFIVGYHLVHVSCLNLHFGQRLVFFMEDIHIINPKANPQLAKCGYFRQQGNVKPVHGALFLLSTHEKNTLPGKQSFSLDIALTDNVRCLLVQSGKKITYFSDNRDDKESKENSLTKSNSTNDLSDVSTKSGTICSTTIQDPYILSITVTPKVEYLIVANRSVWDYINENELLDELENHRHKNSVLIAKRITDMVRSYSCRESLSLILVRFKWHSSSSRSLIINKNLQQRKPSITNKFGPLSYYSVTSDGLVDISNPLAAVITPDSAIESDQSSGLCSLADNDSAGKQHSKELFINTITTEANKNDVNNDTVSIANTSESQMSVEQFRCWEYMLEQNTRLLFKKELDSLSKGVFQRNQRLRKSVHFPYKQGSPISELNAFNSSESQRSNNMKSPSSSKSGDPSFYTLSKAKSLTQLLEDEPMKLNSSINFQSSIVNKDLKITETDETDIDIEHSVSVMMPKPHFPLFTNANAGFLESVRSVRGTVLGGQNAAYFGSAQRLLSQFAVDKPKHTVPIFDEIQELKISDSIKQDTRLKKYWDNKITEL